MYNAIDLTFKCLVCPCFLANFYWIDQHIDGRRHQKAMEKFIILDQGNSQSKIDLGTAILVRNGTLTT